MVLSSQNAPNVAQARLHRLLARRRGRPISDCSSIKNVYRHTKYGKTNAKKKRSSDYLVIQLCTRQTGAFTTVSTPQKFSVWQPPLGCGVAEVWWVDTVGFDVFWGGGYFLGVRRACL